MSTYPPLPPPPGGAPPPPTDDPRPEAPRASAARVFFAVAGVLVIVLGVAGGTAWWIRGAEPICDSSTVESARFGYCLAAPGWQYTNEQGSSSLPYDELVHPDSSSVRILAVQLSAGEGLDEVVENVRRIETGEGIDPGEIEERRVAGVPAAQWDLAVESGDVQVQVREVVFVRRGMAWRIQLIAEDSGFETRLRDFERILRSWIFR